MNKENNILLVDDEPSNLKLLRRALSNDYELLFANNGDAALIAAEQHKPDLILLDVMMPGKNGFDVCNELKMNRKTENIPVIFVTAMGEQVNEKLGFDVGAVDFIIKPISIPIVKRRIKTHLSLVRTKDVEELATSAIKMLGEAGHYNDTDTGLHIWRMAAYASSLAKASGWSNQDAKLMELAAPMHDMGKIGVPDYILKAPRKLTDDEWLIMKSHTTIGHSILSKSGNPIFKLAAEIALSHHEKWDGSGYPNSLKGYEISESCRIVAIADVFDALTMKRPYKDAWSTEAALEYLAQNAGTHFDPHLVDLFIGIKDDIMKIKEEMQD